MQEFILSIIEQFGYLGVFLLIAIENIFPPIPSEVILLFGGFATSSLDLNIIVMIIVSTLGSMLGAFILYFAGRILHKDRLKTIVRGKIGKLLCLKENDIDKADTWFENKGNKAVFLCRFVPIVRSLISIPAGMNKMNLIKFTLYTLSGSLIWNTVLLIVGNKVGENWVTIAEIIDNYSNIVLVILIILLISFISIFYYKRLKKKNVTNKE